MLALISAITASFGSIFFLGRIAYNLHDVKKSRSLSELAVLESKTLRKFRQVLLMCGTLFAISIYLFIAPMLHNRLIAAAWSIEYIGVIFVAMIPALGKTFKLHVTFAQVMGAGMLALTYVFYLSLPRFWNVIELIIGVFMTLFAIATYLDRRHYIQHELAFIFLSHFTIVLAALSLL